MARLLRPVTKIISEIPAAAASSTAYWIRGLSTIGSISFGLAFVTGKKRLPRPATGNTAFVIFCMAIRKLCVVFLDELAQRVLIEYRNPELLRLREFAAGILAGDDVIGFG